MAIGVGRAADIGMRAQKAEVIVGPDNRLGLFATIDIAFATNLNEFWREKVRSRSSYHLPS
jgi:hypothetical protein